MIRNIRPDAASHKRNRTFTKSMKIELLPADREELLSELQKRFEENMNRHNGLNWTDVNAKIAADPTKLWSLGGMESTGGEPDVVGFDTKTNEFIFFDCSPESPKGRRSLCYDRAAWESRKENKPATSAQEMAAAMGLKILSEEEYRDLQTIGKFDLKTSSWLETPSAMRVLGGAIFGDRRFDRIFTYHNGAESYYAGRAFRGSLRL